MKLKYILVIFTNCIKEYKRKPPPLHRWRQENAYTNVDMANIDHSMCVLNNGSNYLYEMICMNTNTPSVPKLDK